MLLTGMVIFPGRVSNGAAQGCEGTDCPGNGAILWTAGLVGSWQVSGGIDGTVPSQGQAYLGFGGGSGAGAGAGAGGGGVAAIGIGLSVAAYDAGTGAPLWTTSLTGYPDGSAITSVRVWPWVVTVGVTTPAVSPGSVAGSAGAGGSAGAASVPTGREEVVLDGANGSMIASFPAGQYGGAVSASRRETVIIGPGYVTCYRNRTGKPVWRVPVGANPQAWRVDGTDLYMTISAQGVVGTAPVTAVRQISLRTGAQRLIRPVVGTFPGSLAGVEDGILLFAGPGGLSGYSAQGDPKPWYRAGMLYVGNDPVQHILYVDAGTTLAGIDPATGDTKHGIWLAGPAGTYGVRDGIALGLDSGAGGAAWGYGLAQHQVMWTSAPLPWPHYFVDLSGLGGSARADSGIVLLVTCGRTGAPVASPSASGGSAGKTALACLRPELVAIER